MKDKTRSAVRRDKAYLATLLLAIGLSIAAHADAADPLPLIEVEGQPLAANAQRVVQALDFLGASLAGELQEGVRAAGAARDARQLQKLLDPQVVCLVSINPESRVRVERGAAKAVLQQAGYTPLLVKVINHSDSTARLKVTSPQAGPPYAGVAKGTMERQRQQHLRENENPGGANRFLDVSLFSAPPMTANLSGLEVEYAIALVYSSEAGRREATLAFDIGQGTQDLGFRGEAPVLFDVRPAVAVKLDVKDCDGQATTARLTFSDARGTQRWTKQQGGFSGFPHSAGGMQVTTSLAAKRMLDQFDANKNRRLEREETASAVLPEPFEKIDLDQDGGLNEAELFDSHDRVADQLPNVAIPDQGGHEIFVSTAHGACDFICTPPTGCRPYVPSPAGAQPTISSGTEPTYGPGLRARRLLRRVRFTGPERAFAPARCATMIGS